MPNELEKYLVDSENHSDLAPLPAILSRAFAEPVGVDNGPPTGRVAESCGLGFAGSPVAAEFSVCAVFPDVSVVLQVLMFSVLHKGALATEYNLRWCNGTDTGTLIANQTSSSPLVRLGSPLGALASVPFAASALSLGNEPASLGTRLAAVQFAAGITGRHVFDFRPHGVFLYGTKGGLRPSLTMWCATVNQELVGDVVGREWRLR